MRNKDTDDYARMPLTQTIDEEDGSEEEDPERRRLRTHWCLEVRVRLEKLAKKSLQRRHTNLNDMIDALRTSKRISIKLAWTMHKVRELGNQAAHDDRSYRDDGR